MKFKKVSLIVLGLTISALDAKRTSQTSDKTITEQQKPAPFRKDPEYGNVYYKPTVSYQEVREPKEHCLIIFDLNGVIFDKHYNQFKMTLDLIRKKGVMYTSKLISLVSQMLYKKYQLKKEGKAEGFVWDAMMSMYEDSHDPVRQEMIHDLRQLTTQANHLNPDMARLLQKLRRAGHRPVILSNMGSKVLDTQIRNLQENNEPNLSETELKETIDFLKNRTHSVVSTARNEWLHKPDTAAYELVIKKNKEFLSKHKNPKILFIDDKKRNITAALEHGCDIGILFNTAKNFEETIYNVLHLKD